MESKGSEWPEEFTERLDKERKFDTSILRSCTQILGLKVLDVGSGPMTNLGVTIDNSAIDLTACDPLAPLYIELAEKYHITFPIKTEQAFAEDLSSFYQFGTFDLVHCRNALDHSFDPIRGIDQMLMVTKSSGRVRLVHWENEAVNGSYDGFHQWNFEVENGDFIVWNQLN